jgi:hypothetical protein
MAAMLLATRVALAAAPVPASPRERLLINDDWRFIQGDPNGDSSGLGLGGDSKRQVVSAYELHAADFGSSADKVFAAQDDHPYVAGQFVWSGWDYLGEPTPYYGARSSYFGIIDLAGFKKDRFYLYQAHWRPDFPIMVTPRASSRSNPMTARPSTACAWCSFGASPASRGKSSLPRTRTV